MAPAAGALPDEDPAIDALAPSLRQVVGKVWAGRGQAERQAGEAFRYLSGVLRSIGAADLALSAERAVDDELRHAALCVAVAARYFGRELPSLQPLPLIVPAHEGAPPELLPSLYLFGMCAINETSAGAYLEMNLAGTRSPTARAALRLLFADEIAHARIGWTHLASLAPGDRARLLPWIGPMLRTNLAAWRGHPPLPDEPALSDHGCPPVGAIGDAVAAAARDLVLPGCAHLGLDTAGLADFLD